MQGDISFFELGVPDVDRARTFWSSLVGWEFPPTGVAGQVSVSTPSGVGGVHGDDAGAELISYVEVDDIDAAVARVRELGGTAEDARMEEPGFGRFTQAVDDQGVAFGLHQPPASR